MTISTSQNHSDNLAQALAQASPSAQGCIELLNGLRVSETARLAVCLFEPFMTNGLPMVAEQYGERVYALLQGLQQWHIRLALYPPLVGSTRARSLESLRKMLLTTTDLEVLMIGLAQGLQALRDAQNNPNPPSKKLLAQMRDVLVPLTNRLGIAQLKWEMEDRILRLDHPEDYHAIANALALKRTEREAYLEEVRYQLHQRLASEAIHPLDIAARAKHIYSIWRKMQKKQRSFEQIMDVHAVRILVNDVRSCYQVLDEVHRLWSPIASEFDDYINAPKPNGYQSLHTAVVGPKGHTVEVQIRTMAMHQQSEFGVAAHWLYKECPRKQASLERLVSWFRQALDNQSHESLPEQEEQTGWQGSIFVITPKNEVIELSQGATPLDMAYAVHTDIGHRCRGAQVNGRMVPLSRPLENGDQVEILLDQQPHPSRKWLEQGYLQSSRAKAKVRHWFRQQRRETHLEMGQQMVDRELRRLQVTLDGNELAQIAQQCRQPSVEALYIALGCGDFALARFTQRIQQRIWRLEPPTLVKPSTAPKKATKPSHIAVDGFDQFMTNLANCCQPLPGDAIGGFITQGRGVSIHRVDCPNWQALCEGQVERVVSVSWQDQAIKPQRHQVSLTVQAEDRPHLLYDITQVFRQRHINIVQSQTQADNQGELASCHFVVSVHTAATLSHAMDALELLPGVISVTRGDK